MPKFITSAFFNIFVYDRIFIKLLASPISLFHYLFFS